MDLKKITQQGRDFNYTENNINFSGSLVRDKKLVNLTGKLFGELEVSCDRCGEDINFSLDENIILKISDGIYHSDKLDDIVIEADNGKITINEIFQGEIEVIRNDYHCCQNCNNLEDISQEF